MSSPSKTLLVLAGTRPEAIKLAPVILEGRRRGAFRVLLCATAQHRHMLDQALNTFELQPDFDLDLMEPGQTLPRLASRLLERLPVVLEEVKPAAVMVQGDTTTAMAGAIASFYAGIPVAHVEAGLRTGDLAAPFPEEGNRKVISAVVRWHFAPTARARENLLLENVPADRVHVTGNTVIDALKITATRLDQDPAADGLGTRTEGETILVTGHRRESFGEGMQNLCAALLQIAAAHSNVQIVYPVHPNPHVKEPVCAALGSTPNIRLIDPLDYPEFVAALRRCTFVITDSGGVQEEAPAFGKPVLVTRSVTERPEAVDAGCALLVGTHTETIVARATELLTRGDLYRKMSRATNPFGDGTASAQILAVLEREL